MQGLLLFVIVACVAGAWASDTTTTWQQRGADAVLYVNVLAVHHSDSLSQCGVLCHRQPGCWGFDFNERDSECRLHDGAAITPSTPQSVARGDELWRNFALPNFACDTTGACMLFIDSMVTFHQARAICKELRMDLASGETRTKINFFRGAANTLIGNVDLWLSGTDEGHEGSWKWLNTGAWFGENLWGSGQPDNAGSNEHCLHWMANNYYNDIPCTHNGLRIACAP